MNDTTCVTSRFYCRSGATANRRLKFPNWLSQRPGVFQTPPFEYNTAAAPFFSQRKNRPVSPFHLPTDTSPQKRVALERRLQQIREALGDAERVLLLMHNDPDPDALASGLALERLLREIVPGKALTLAHGGIIGRAENLSMAQALLPQVLRIPIFEVEEILSRYDAICLIDTQPGAGNHLLYTSGFPLDQVAVAIDHHPPRRGQIQAAFHDVRPDVGACSTILCEYLAAAQIVPDTKLATALFYGIKTDTRGLSRHAGPLDAWAYMSLHGLIDTDLLGHIEQAQLPAAYFKNLSYALAHANRYRCPSDPPPARSPRPRKTSPDPHGDERGNDFVNGDGCQGDVVISILGEMERPDMAAEVADLLLRLDGVRWVICLGLYDSRVVISVRNDGPGGHAGRLVRLIVGKTGTAGGHESMAGGRILMLDATPAERTAAVHSLVPLFLEKLGLADAAPEPLLEAST